MVFLRHISYFLMVHLLLKCPGTQLEARRGTPARHRRESYAELQQVDFTTKRRIIASQYSARLKRNKVNCSSCALLATVLPQGHSNVKGADSAEDTDNANHEMCNGDSPKELRAIVLDMATESGRTAQRDNLHVQTVRLLAGCRCCGGSAEKAAESHKSQKEEWTGPEAAVFDTPPLRVDECNQNDHDGVLPCCTENSNNAIRRSVCWEALSCGGDLIDMVISGLVVNRAAY